MIRYKRAEEKKLASDAGIALMMVLWVLTLLIVMTFAFSVTVRTEALSTGTFMEQLENKYLAEAGFQRALLEIFHRNACKSGSVKPAGAGMYSVDGRFHQGKIGDGYYQYAIMDESGKISINLLTDTSAVLLNNLLVGLGVEKQQADAIVDSILDWKDPDDLHRLNGAESDYYQSLPTPYRSKDADFETLEELLLVQGVTQDILYGTEDRPGLLPFLTVHSPSRQINVFSARPEMLKAVPFMTNDMVQAIVRHRDERDGSLDNSGLQAIMATGDMAKAASYLTTADSNVYYIESIGYKKEREGAYALNAVVRIEGGDRFRILAYQSPAHAETRKNESLSR